MTVTPPYKRVLVGGRTVDSFEVGVVHARTTGGEGVCGYVHHSRSEWLVAIG